MTKIILACDLDNTLIYSYKHRTPEDICVEWLEGQEQSFMTAQTIRLLPQLARRLLLLPVTTRSRAQYQRLVWPQGSPEWAITTNGGLLLHKGEVDTEWRDFALGMAAGFHDSLQRLEAELGNIAGYARRRMVDDMYLYVVCQDKAAAEQCLADYADYGGLQVRRGGRKVYFLPPQINKGAALQRLREQRPDIRLIAAGDSELDVPMLAAADIALLPNAELAALLPEKVKYICPANEHFAEFVLNMALRLAEN